MASDSRVHALGVGQRSKSSTSLKKMNIPILFHENNLGK